MASLAARQLLDRMRPLVERLRPHGPAIARGAAIALVSGGLVFLILKDRPEWLGVTPPRADFQARPGTAVAAGADTVTALGRLEPETEVVEINVMQGTRIDRVLVKEGERVPAGAPLAYLDGHGEMEAGRDLAAKQLEEAQKRYVVDTAHGEAAVTWARLRVRQAEESTRKAVEAQEAVVRSAQAAREKAGLDLDRVDRLHKEGVVSISDRDASSLASRQAVEGVADQEANLARQRTNFDLELQISRADLRSAETGLSQAQLALQLGSTRENLKLAEARLERTVVRAPFAGEVLKILTHAGESVGRGLVRRGQRATVTSKAFPGQAINGKVERVASIIHKKDVLSVDPTTDADARVVEARIRLDDSKIAARFNQLQVDVAIAVGAH